MVVRRDDRSLFRRGIAVVVELVRLHPLPFTVSVFGAAIFAAGTVVATIVLGRVTDQVVLPTFETGQVPEGSLGWAALAVLSVSVIRAVGVVLRRYFAAMTSERAQMTLRYRLIDRYLGLPMSWHHRLPTGQLLAHAENDVEVTSDVIHPLPFSLGVGFLGLFSTIALIAVDATIAAVALAIFPALIVLNQMYSRRVEGPSSNVQVGVGRVSSIAHESFDGALVVKTLGRAEAEGERFAEAARYLQEQRRRVGFIRSGFEAALDALPNLGIVAVVVVGAYRIQAGAMTLGDLVQVASLFTILALPMRVFGFFLETLPPSVVARKRLQIVFDEELPDALADGVMPAERPSVEGRSIAFSYPSPDEEPGAVVLDGLEVTIEPGEVVALVGSTGSGKSTLCMLLAGLVTPDSGEVLIGGVGVDELDPQRRIEAIALVFQESFLFADTLRSNILLGLETSALETAADGAVLDERLTMALRVARADRFVADLPEGLDTVIGERGVTLSGGQRQRIALARALVRRPSVLLLDDATSSVDAVVEREILAGLSDEIEATTLIVAQRISTIELADRVLYLRQGRIVAAGTHAELSADPGYRALVRAYEAGES